MIPFLTLSERYLARLQTFVRTLFVIYSIQSMNIPQKLLTFAAYK